MDDKTSGQAVLSSIWHTPNRTSNIYPVSKPIQKNDKTRGEDNLSPIRAAGWARRLADALRRTWRCVGPAKFTKADGVRW